MKHFYVTFFLFISFDIFSQAHTFNLLGRFRSQTQNAKVITNDIKSQIDSFQVEKYDYLNISNEIIVNYESQKGVNYTSYRFGFLKNRYKEISNNDRIDSQNKYNFIVRESTFHVGFGKGVTYQYNRLNFQAGGQISLFFTPKNKKYIVEELVQSVNTPPNETTYTRLDEFPATIYSYITLCSRINFKIYKNIYVLSEYNLGLYFFFQRRDFSRYIKSFDKDGTEINNFQTKIQLNDKSFGTVSTSPALGIRYIIDK